MQERWEIQRNGKVEYTDYCHSETIDEWNMTPRMLVRYPQYYKAIHSYADQLMRQNEIDVVNVCMLLCVRIYLIIQPQMRRYHADSSNERFKGYGRN